MTREEMQRDIGELEELLPRLRDTAGTHVAVVEILARMLEVLQELVERSDGDGRWN